MAETVLMLAVLVAPLVLGAIAGATGRPWWVAAVVAVLLFLAAAIVPEPEAGESRLVAGDLVFLAVVAAFVTGITWLAALVARRVVARRA